MPWIGRNCQPARRLVAAVQAVSANDVGRRQLEPAPLVKCVREGVGRAVRPTRRKRKPCESALRKVRVQSLPKPVPFDTGMDQDRQATPRPLPVDDSRDAIRPGHWQGLTAAPGGQNGASGSGGRDVLRTWPGLVRSSFHRHVPRGPSNSPFFFCIALLTMRTR
jgi:hypothetical protein